VLADSLRTDEKLFRRVPKISQFLVRLRAENRTAKQLMDHMLAVSFQVRDELQRYYPEMLRLGSWHNEPWLWDLVAAAPTPKAARKLREPRVQNILKLRRIRRYTAQQVLDSLRATPLPVAEGVAEACSQAVLALLPVLQTMHEQRKQCLKRIDSLLDQAVVELKQADAKGEEKEQGKVRGGQTAESESHRAMLRDAALLLTLPGLGRRIVTSVLARAHLALHERDYSALRRLAGVAPVSRRTGGRSKSPMVAMRRARDAELTNAVYLWAWAATRLDPGFKARYAALRAKGHNHARALRGLADRLLYLAIGVLKSGRPYQPNPSQPNSA
jgi:transposase